MTGQDLLDKLSRLSKEELSYPIVEDDEWGLWNFTGFYIDNDADFYKPAKGDSSMGDYTIIPPRKNSKPINKVIRF